MRKFVFFIDDIFNWMWTVLLVLKVHLLGSRILLLSWVQIKRKNR